MFGYISINKDELKIKDYKKYQSYYCGVCHSLKEQYGLAGQITLTYDMTFLAILLSSLYEDSTVSVKQRCIPHPFQSHNAIFNEYTDYAAAMNILLTYYKLKDNWVDEHSVKSKLMAGTLSRSCKKAAAKYPRQSEAIRKYIEEQSEYEENNEINIDKVSGATGEMLATVFDMKQDEWHNALHRMGYNMGKFIYIMDAYDDIDKDIKKACYNPFINIRNLPNFDERCRQMLVLVAAEASKAFESLPIFENADILRNILYSGIWNKFNNRKQTER